MFRRTGLALLFAALPACSFDVSPVDLSFPEEDLATPADLRGAPDDLTDLGETPDLTSEPDLFSPDLQVLPVLTVTRANIPGSLNLTDEGTLDWAHFGLNASTSVNRKANITPLISMTPIGNQNRYSMFNVNMSWSDGDPTKTTTDTSTGIYAPGTNNGYTVTVPAGTAPRTLRVYVGEFRGTGTLIAHLSDNSLPDVTTTHTNNNGIGLSRFHIEFRATQAATLTVTWVLTNDNTGGTVDLLAATHF
jgi:hypothetical protein